MDPNKIYLEELEISTYAAVKLIMLGIETVGELLELETSVLPPRAAKEVQSALADLGMIWGKAVEAEPYKPPKERRIPRLTVNFKPGASEDIEHRAGGNPSDWGSEPWPVCLSCGKPMSFVLQLIGKAAGGEIDIGHYAGLQVFICHNINSCQPWASLSCANTVLFRELLSAKTRKSEVKVELNDAWKINLSKGYDDSILLKQPEEDDEEEYEEAFAFCSTSKVGGIPVSGNEPAKVKCPECNEQMKFLAQFDENVDCPLEGDVFIYICPNFHAGSYEAVP